MKPARTSTPLKQRFISLLLVLAGAICLVANRRIDPSRLSPLGASGIVLMIAGLVFRFKKSSPI